MKNDVNRPPPCPALTARQTDVDAAADRIVRNVLAAEARRREREDARARATDEKLHRVVAGTHHLSQAMGDLREREGKAHAFTHRAAADLLTLGHRSDKALGRMEAVSAEQVSLLRGSATDTSVSLALLTEVTRRVQRIEEAVATFAAVTPSVPPSPSAFEREMGEAFAELALPAPSGPPPVPADDAVPETYAEIPVSPIADNVIELFPDGKGEGFAMTPATTRTMRRAQGPMRLALFATFAFATAAFASSDAPRSPAAMRTPRCRAIAAADALPAQDAHGRAVVVCDGKPSVVLRHNADGTIQVDPLPR